MSSIIIVPAFNEADNIAFLIEKILYFYPSGPDVLVVDDHSQDATVACVESLAQKSSRVKILKNRYSERGLAYGYKTGFVYALEKGYEWIVGMDADFSHDPSDINRFLAKEHEADWIIGSRYVQGGSAQGLKKSRSLISFWANKAVRLKTGIGVQDMTSGFNCIHRSVLEKIDFLSIPSRNFIYQVELKLLAYHAGFRLKEIPVVFHPRRAGKSKFSFKVGWEALGKIARLKRL